MKLLHIVIIGWLLALSCVVACLWVRPATDSQSSTTYSTNETLVTQLEFEQELSRIDNNLLDLALIVEVVLKRQTAEKQRFLALPEEPHDSNPLLHCDVQIQPFFRTTTAFAKETPD